MGNDGGGVEDLGAAGLTDSEELGVGLGLGRDNELNHVLDEGLVTVGGQEGDIEEGVGVDEAWEGSLGPAVSSDEKVASAEVEDQQPSVNEKAESLVVGSLDPADEGKWKMGEVKSPNED